MSTCNPLRDITLIENEALARSWQQGRLHCLVGRLYFFVEQNRAEILRRAGPNPSLERMVEATRELIAEKQSVDMRAEVRDQLEAMHCEIWYRGECHDHDVARIKREWIDLHAANWRRWLVREYSYVAGRCAEAIGALLAPATPAPAPARPRAHAATQRTPEYSYAASR